MTDQRVATLDLRRAASTLSSGSYTVVPAGRASGVHRVSKRRPNSPAGVAVAELGVDVHLPLVALHHQLHRLGPALDDLGGGGSVLQQLRHRVPGVSRMASMIEMEGHSSVARRSNGARGG
jgi:hypothetical protein